jgi:hypothetical protein
MDVAIAVDGSGLEPLSKAAAAQSNVGDNASSEGVRENQRSHVVHGAPKPSRASACQSVGPASYNEAAAAASGTRRSRR